jgi:TRAP-type C4-dicarboxylate transport system substrate-binding protein
MLVVALSLTAVSTGVCACECRTFEAGSEDCPTVTALSHKGSLATEHSGGGRIRVFHSRQSGEEKEALEKPPIGAIDLNRTNVALIGTMAPVMNVPAMPLPFRTIERQQEVLVSQKAWSRLSTEDQKMLREVERV